MAPSASGSLRRTALALLLVLAAGSALGAGGASAAPGDAHRCCKAPPASAAPAPAPCQALLPLACCDGTTLPVSRGATRPDAPTSLALPVSTGAAPLTAAPARPPEPGLAQRASPLRLSVVLRL